MPTPDECPPVDLVGLVEIAVRLDVVPGTPRTWRDRGILPPPDYLISSHPIWCWSTIRDWAADTGRLPDPTAED